MSALPGGVEYSTRRKLESLKTITALQLLCDKWQVVQSSRCCFFIINYPIIFQPFLLHLPPLIMSVSIHRLISCVFDVFLEETGKPIIIHIHFDDSPNTLWRSCWVSRKCWSMFSELLYLYLCDDKFDYSVFSSLDFERCEVRKANSKSNKRLYYKCTQTKRNPRAREISKFCYHFHSRSACFRYNYGNFQCGAILDRMTIAMFSRVLLCKTQDSVHFRFATVATNTPVPSVTYFNINHILIIQT